MIFIIKMAVVYQHRRLDTNEVFYVGIGKTKQRSEVFHGRSIDWQKVLLESQILVEIVTENITIEEAGEIEKNLVKKYGRKDLGLGPLVNLTDGGEYSSYNCGKISIYKEEKSKFINDKDLSIYLEDGWKKGRPSYVSEKIKSKWTKERKIEYSDRFSGSNAYWYGKTGEGTPMYGKKRLDIKGNKHWMKKEKYKKMISDRMSGENNPMYGKIYDAHPRAKKIDQFSLDGSYIRTWNCIIEAKKELNIFHIDKVCSGKRKSAGGYIWKYKN
jgi:hypothetical protein